MIKVIVGGIGSGKTLTTVKEILTNDRKCFVNFAVIHPLAVRLKTSHIIKSVPDESGKKFKNSVNWEFWQDLIKKGESFDIYLDEAHNVLNSRRSMSNWNTLITMWITQIRKIMGGSEDHHLYLITQRLGSLDIVVRDLCHLIIYCKKITTEDETLTKVKTLRGYSEKMINDVHIIKYFFIGVNCRDKFELFMEDNRHYDAMTTFYGNVFFKYYNSYELVTFGDEIYL